MPEKDPYKEVYHYVILKIGDPLVSLQAVKILQESGFSPLVKRTIVYEDQNKPLETLPINIDELEKLVLEICAKNPKELERLTIY